jgi:hypothetical protein
MCAAFDLAKKAMHDCGQPELVYEILANKIIGLAREGETDPIALSKRALTGIGLPQETGRGSPLKTFVRPARDFD